VGLRDFLVGSAIGLAPGVLALSLAADRTVAAVTHPDALSIAGAVGVLALVVIGGAWLRRRLAGPPDPDAERGG
jgi:hypothetical protein